MKSVKLKEKDFISNPHLPPGEWYSSLQLIETIEKYGKELEVIQVNNTTGEAIVAVFLSSNTGIKLCVPWRMDINKSKPRIGQKISPTFGKTYFSDGHRVTINSELSVDVNIWEAPTRFLIT